MEGEIVNRVAKSPLLTLDLEEFYPKGQRFGIDLSQWLEEGLILRDQPFRDTLKSHDWESYREGYVYLHCSTDAIVPAWAYMLIGSHLKGIAREVVVGSQELLETLLFRKRMKTLDLEAYRGRPVIIKGCSNLPVPSSAYVWALQRVQEVARSVMYGEACSAVPLFKKK
ncbi:MAG: DUF2480 family protein [Robiginitalea sp.]|nr:DUF2480 family protein [Robiginitalea sp.]